MYYKAMLFSSGDFKVEEISDEEARGVTTGLYDYCGKKGNHTYAVRKTKEEAEYALKKEIKKQIKEHETKLAELKSVYNKLFNRC